MRDVRCSEGCENYAEHHQLSDLEIYKMAHDLAVEVHKLTLDELPKFEMYEEASQLRRSSKSISINIVEGFGRRRYKAEFLRFLIFAHASCDETMEHLKFLVDTGSLNSTRVLYFFQGYDTLGRKISTFIRGVEREHRLHD